MATCNQYPVTPRITLKAPVWYVQEPESELYFALCGSRPKLKPRALATPFTSRDQANTCVADRIPFTPCDIQRHDA